MADDREWHLWHSGKGTLETISSIAETKNSKHCTLARLGEPYDSTLGWFNFDKLEKHGREEISGYVILSPEQWEIERKALLEKFRERKVTTSFGTPPKDAEHRSVLNLPRQGPLFEAEINYAYRIAVKTAHPDGGGSDEHFWRISEARDALLLRAVR